MWRRWRVGAARARQETACRNRIGRRARCGRRFRGGGRHSRQDAGPGNPARGPQTHRASAVGGCRVSGAGAGSHRHRRGVAGRAATGQHCGPCAATRSANSTKRWACDVEGGVIVAIDGPAGHRKVVGVAGFGARTAEPAISTPVRCTASSPGGAARRNRPGGSRAVCRSRRVHGVVGGLRPR